MNLLRESYIINIDLLGCLTQRYIYGDLYDQHSHHQIIFLSSDEFSSYGNPNIFDGGRTKPNNEMYIWRII